MCESSKRNEINPHRDRVFLQQGGHGSPAAVFEILGFLLGGLCIAAPVRPSFPSEFSFRCVWLYQLQQIFLNIIVHPLIHLALMHSGKTLKRSSVITFISSSCLCRSSFVAVKTRFCSFISFCCPYLVVGLRKSKQLADWTIIREGTTFASDGQSFHKMYSRFQSPVLVLPEKIK